MSRRWLGLSGAVLLVICTTAAPASADEGSLMLQGGGFKNSIGSPLGYFGHLTIGLSVNDWDVGQALIIQEMLFGLEETPVTTSAAATYQLVVAPGLRYLWDFGGMQLFYSIHFGVSPYYTAATDAQPATWTMASFRLENAVGFMFPIGSRVSLGVTGAVSADAGGALAVITGRAGLALAFKLGGSD